MAGMGDLRSLMKTILNSLSASKSSSAKEAASAQTEGFSVEVPAKAKTPTAGVLAAPSAGAAASKRVGRSSKDETKSSETSPGFQNIIEKMSEHIAAASEKAYLEGAPKPGTSASAVSAGGPPPQRQAAAADSRQKENARLNSDDTGTPSLPSSFAEEGKKKGEKGQRTLQGEDLQETEGGGAPPSPHEDEPRSPTQSSDKAPERPKKKRKGEGASKNQLPQPGGIQAFVVMGPDGEVLNFGSTGAFPPAEAFAGIPEAFSRMAQQLGLPIDAHAAESLREALSKLGGFPSEDEGGGGGRQQAFLPQQEASQSIPTKPPKAPQEGLSSEKSAVHSASDPDKEGQDVGPLASKSSKSSKVNKSSTKGSKSSDSSTKGSKSSDSSTKGSKSSDSSTKGSKSSDSSTKGRSGDVPPPFAPPGDGETLFERAMQFMQEADSSVVSALMRTAEEHARRLWGGDVHTIPPPSVLADILKSLPVESSEGPQEKDKDEL
ncbi:hypothetical protein cyc_08935 [Cyclospora cayetanensis]|uniref:Uncharacterized protein n=1 Tax=Cyclospora cayetanensis TaxID=88456 RepID=A0A1D3DB67_9EIME|nr:hypothetical protein cyc_08935 [Cyclospora cayetanensis]